MLDPYRRESWAERRSAFESIVEEVRRFVARMPPVDYSTGSACCPRNYSALGDQRAEILPVQGPHTLPVSARRMMRLARILIFPFFSLSTRSRRSVDRSEHPPACALALAGCSPTANMIAAAADKALMDAIRWLFIVSRIMSVLILRDEHVGVHIACQLS